MIRPATLGQIGKNIAAETALGAADFVSLLRAFAVELDKGASPTDSWTTVCRAHKLTA